MTKVREKLLECYVRFDPVVRVFLTSRCVLYSVVLTAWAGYGKTGALVNRRGEILQGQMTISNIHEIFFSLRICFTSSKLESYYSNSSRKTFLKTGALSNEDNERDTYSFLRIFLHQISKFSPEIEDLSIQ